MALGPRNFCEELHARDAASTTEVNREALKHRNFRWKWEEMRTSMGMRYHAEGHTTPFLNILKNRVALTKE